MARLLVIDADDALIATLEAGGLQVTRVADETRARELVSRGEAVGLLLAAEDARRERDRRRLLAHDLRGPLALIRGHAELLEGPSVSAADRAESLAAIDEAARALADLVNARVEPPSDG